jgi:hypothetical protein
MLKLQAKVKPMVVNHKVKNKNECQTHPLTLSDLALSERAQTLGLPV